MPPWGFTYTSPSYEVVFDKQGNRKLNKNMCPGRKTCPVQLVWVKGQPHLRFCRTQPKQYWGVTPGSDVTKRAKVSAANRAIYKDRFRPGHYPGDPGYLVPVSSAKEAQAIGDAACRCWRKAPDGFYERVRRMTKDELIWRGSFETCDPINKARLGSASR